MKDNFIKLLIYIILLTNLLPGCREKNGKPYIMYWPNGPNSGLVGWTYLFDTWALDPDGDSVAIRFDWGDGDITDWSPWEDTYKLVYMFHSWQDSGTYYVKAQAKDTKEAFSEWSRPHTIIITDTISINNPSILLKSSNGYIDTTYQFLGATIDPDENYIVIRFNRSDGDISDSTRLEPSGDLVWLSHSWSYPDTDYLKAQAKDVGISTSEWSEEHEIKISISGIIIGKSIP